MRTQGWLASTGAIVALVALGACISGDSERTGEAASHVWGGANSTTASVVMVWVDGTNDGSGIVVGERCILTAAHVASAAHVTREQGGKPLVYWTENAGKDPSKSQTSKFAAVEVANLYSPKGTAFDDIGVLFLEKARKDARDPTYTAATLNFKRNAALPIQVNDAGLPGKINVAGKIEGFGLSAANPMPNQALPPGQVMPAPVGQGIQRVGDVNANAYIEVKNQVGGYIFLSPGATGQIAQKGDSGGPFFIDGQVVGVCSQADQSAFLAQKPAAPVWARYTSLAHNEKLILAAIAETCALKAAALKIAFKPSCPPGLVVATNATGQIIDCGIESGGATDALCTANNPSGPISVVASNTVPGVVFQSWSGCTCIEGQTSATCTIDLDAMEAQGVDVTNTSIQCTANYVPTSATCGDGMCSGDETPHSCQADCGSCVQCGDGLCDPSESCSTCAADCGTCPSCGNGVCETGETCASCPADCQDCTQCGDGACGLGETCSNCPSDCTDCGTGGGSSVSASGTGGSSVSASGAGGGSSVISTSVSASGAGGGYSATSTSVSSSSFSATGAGGALADAGSI
jgi:hypothetical protein